MLEDLLRSLITALNANTEALGGKPLAAAAKSAAATPATTAAATAMKAETAPPKKSANDRPTMEMVKAALMEVKNVHGRPAAMKIVKEEGNATELPGIKPARFTAVLAKCAEVMGDEAEAEEVDEAVEEDDL